MKTKLAVAIVLSLFLTITSSTHAACSPHTRPIASASANPTLVSVNESVSFSSDGSHATCGGSIIEYQWFFDDGNESTSPNPSYSYSEPGDYDPRLRVKCNHYVWSLYNDTDTVTVDDGVMHFVDESTYYAGQIWVLTSDANYVYASGYSVNVVRKYRKSDMDFVDQTSWGKNTGTTYALISDDTYLYVGAGWGTQKVLKYRKSDMSYEANSPPYGQEIFALTSDDTYVYAGGGYPTDTVRKYLKSDMSFVDPNGESPSYGGAINALTSDADYVYAAGGYGDYKVKKYLKSDMSFVAESNSYGDDIYALTSDDTYVYAGGYGVGEQTVSVRKYRKSDMTFVAESPEYDGEAIFALTSDDTYVYAGGYPTNTVRKYRKINMTFVAESESAPHEGYTNTLTSDDTYVYAAGGYVRYIKKYLK